ncbi:MAG: type I-E CRISPR-associated protein Cas6/Cse3/CasE [Pseudomonadota bacterium]
MFMIDLPLDSAQLMRFAHRQGHGRLADDDFGYAAHAWLVATLGKLAPKPFRLLENRQGLRMLGYTDQPIDALRDHAQTFAEPGALNVCEWSAAAGKSMPTAWQSGRRFGFEVRACPVSRAERERDVYLVALSRAQDAGAEQLSRPQVYSEWLARQLSKEGAAQTNPAAINVIGFRRVRSQRLSRASEGAKRRAVERPDALFAGELTVENPDAFSGLLARGVGRHRAFGYGMLLLRPPR